MLQQFYSLDARVAEGALAPIVLCPRRMLYRGSVFLHILAACIWVGGIAFFALVLVPVMRRRRDAQVAALIQAVGLRFRIVGWASVVVLVATGIGNLLSRVPAEQLSDPLFWTSRWGSVLAAKLVLVALMLGVSALHDVLGARAGLLALRDAASRDAQRLRALASRLGRVLGVLVLGIVLLAVLLVRGP